MTSKVEDMLCYRAVSFLCVSLRETFAHVHKETGRCRRACCNGEKSGKTSNCSSVGEWIS